MRPKSPEYWAFLRGLIARGAIRIPDHLRGLSTDQIVDELQGREPDYIVVDDIELSHGKPVIIVDGDRRFMLEELPPHETPSWVLVGKLACQAVAPITFIP